MIDKVLANRYRIIEKIGIGGMAVVYKAQDEVLGRSVAVKLMLPQYAADATFAARFRQEAQAAANLQSPYIVNIYDWGQDGETYYIVMEYVRGVDLKSAVEQRGALNQRKVAQIGSQICSALSVAHGYDIIHRDIKSQNIMIQTNGDAKVMDFGIAHAGNAHMTQTGSVLGTAHYVSPEQAQGYELTAASDIYSLGIVLYEAATGHIPFDGPDAVSVALKQVNELPAPPSAFNPDIDPALEAIIMKAIAKNPADRFSSTDEMRLALNDYLGGQPVDLGPVPGGAVTTVMNPVAAPGMGNATSVMPSVGDDARKGNGYNQYNGYERSRTTRQKSKKGMVIGIIVAAVVVALGVGLAVGFFSNKVRVPDVTNMDKEQATAAIEKAGFALGSVTEAYSDTYEEGKVCEQTPSANKMGKKNTKIAIVISKGPETGSITVPDLQGMTADEANTALSTLGLRGVEGDKEDSATIEAGKVVSQTPLAGKKVKEGATVTYRLSSGGVDATVPDVLGMEQGQAVSTLQAAGFAYIIVTSYSDSVSSGFVISQTPNGGEAAKTKSKVTLTVSKGAETVVVPSVLQMSEGAAVSALQEKGLGAAVSYVGSGYAPSQAGLVVDQSTGAGEQVPKGSTVNITVYQPSAS